MLLIFIIPVTLFTVHSVVAQDSIKLTIIDYLIKVGDLQTTDTKLKYLENIFIVDLLKHTEVGNNDEGIYKFGTFSDHSKSYLLLLNGEGFQILGLYKLDEDLLLELDFLKIKKTPANKVLKYIEATIIEYQKNLSVIPWTNE